MTNWDTANLPLDKLYGVQTGYVDNAKTTEYDSGRVVSFQRDTRNRRVYAVSYAATKTQEKAFFAWYENDLGGNAGTFRAPSLRENETAWREYRMTAPPKSSGVNIKEIIMQWEEV